MSHSDITIYNANTDTLKSNILFPVSEPEAEIINYEPLPPLDVVFCDYSTIVYAPDDLNKIIDPLTNLLFSYGCNENQSDHMQTFNFPDISEHGKLIINRYNSKHIITISGGFLQSLRCRKFYVPELNQYQTGLEQLGEIVKSVPYRISRLDSTLDENRSYKEMRKELVKKHNRLPKGITFTGQPVTVHRGSTSNKKYSQGWHKSKFEVSSIESVISSISYDKALQLLQKYGITIDHERARTEIRHCPTSSSPLQLTFEDVLNPAPLFYSRSKPIMKKKPIHIKKWKPVVKTHAWGNKKPYKDNSPEAKITRAIQKENARHDKQIEKLESRMGGLYNPDDKINNISPHPNDFNTFKLFNKSHLTTKKGIKTIPKRKLNFTDNEPDDPEYFYIEDLLNVA